MTEIDKLHFLAKELDPFNPILNDRSLNYLKDLELDEYINDPFSLTNEVLKRLHEHDSIPNSSLLQ